jgi:Ser/Thr protein kinase RdoA (MazF antagonist)
LLASRNIGLEHALVLEDLDAAGFAGRTDEANDAELDALLGWLASFHARFVGEPLPDGVWPIGTYWHLDTRKDELANIADRALREAAPIAAARLAGAKFQTLLHGDAKDANFCFARDGSVAAVDFQYTGGGPGIVDVAYLLHGRRDEPPDGIDAERLDRYFDHLRRALPTSVDATALEAEWRELYPIALLDFSRFLAGWRR